MGTRLSNSQLFLYGLVIFLIGAVVGSVSLTYPFGRDQAFYAYAGKLLLEGKMNYLNVFDLRPPGSHLFFAAAQSVLGESMLNIRIFDIIWESLTAFIIFIISFKLTNKKTLSLAASFIYLLLYFRQDYWHTLQADGMLNLPFAVSILLLVSSYYDHSFIKLFAAGVFLAAALIFKYTVISFLPLVVICFLLSSKEVRSIRFKNIAVFISGTVFLCLLIGLWYYFTGALDSLIDIQFGQTSKYTKIAYETESGGFIVNNLVRLFTISVYSPLIWFSVIGFVILLFKRKLIFPHLLIFSWILTSLFSLIIQWKFYTYHFLVIIASLSVGAVMSTSVLTDLFGENRKKFVMISFAVIFIGFILYAGKPYAGNYQTLLSYASGKETLNDVYIKNGFTEDSVFMISKTLHAIDYVNQKTSIDDKLFIWGYDPLVYYISGRKCVSKFVYHVPLLWKAENSAFRNEFIEKLNAEKPKVIIIASNDPIYTISGYNEDSKQLVNRFPEFKNILDTKYSFSKRIDDYDFYEIKNW